ncbi:pyridoxal phosphate-dependent aminotransferase [Sulfoacidibacillus thermotolerans]|uniref:Aminotransferase n=1 Tax=Sulfoacidibacillus thermotolerans TaxID=1765684 RepID=A0A2U3D9I3_SULT2|nr:aspartate aminotransferase [Sulfoacidibacillus thermotolerans]
MLDLSKRARAISPSPTLSIDAKTKALVASGVDVINLSVGEPDFATPDQASLAAIAAITAHFTKYTAVSGILELRQAIAKKLFEENELKYTANEIIVSSGAKQSLYNIFMTILDPQDEVLLPTPYWVSYPEQIRLCEGIPVPLFTDESTQFKITPEQVERAITNKTKAILLNSPSNPTGTVYTPEEIQALADVLARYEIYVISDEIYEQLTYDVSHYSIASIPVMRDRTFVVNGFSKTFAMTGWRVGYVAAPEHLIQAMSSFQSHTTANPSSISQKAALGALGTFDRSTVTEYRKRRDFIVSALSRLEGIECVKPEGAFYVFPKASGVIGRKLTRPNGEKHVIESVDQLCEYLLTDAHLSVVPGTGFGAPNNFRISYATSLTNLEIAADRLRTFFDHLE